MFKLSNGDFVQKDAGIVNADLFIQNMAEFDKDREAIVNQTKIKKLL